MDIKKIAFDRALNMLRGAGCKFIIIDEEGVQHVEGGLVLGEPKKHTRNLRYPMGTLKAHYLPHIEKLEPGELAVVPYGEFDPDHLAPAVSAGCFTLWGSKNYMTHANAAGVEVMRVG